MRHFRIKIANQPYWIEAVVANVDQAIDMVRILESSDQVECYTLHEAGIDRPLQPWHMAHGGMAAHWKKWRKE